MWMFFLITIWHVELTVEALVHNAQKRLVLRRPKTQHRPVHVCPSALSSARHFDCVMSAGAAGGPTATSAAAILGPMPPKVVRRRRASLLPGFWVLPARLVIRHRRLLLSGLFVQVSMRHGGGSRRYRRFKSQPLRLRFPVVPLCLPDSRPSPDVPAKFVFTGHASVDSAAAGVRSAPDIARRLICDVMPLFR